MQQVDHLRPEELPVSVTSSNNETISLKTNHQKPEEGIDNKGTEEEVEEIDTRTCFQKTCGKMGPGSMRGCIFNLCILSLGTGSLALPQKNRLYESRSFTNSYFCGRGHKLLDFNNFRRCCP
jgi:hypothetical protein